MDNVVITIDVDFFTREDLFLDFGHSEEDEMYMSDVVWQTRYQTCDLFKHTSLDYADCAPYMLLPILRNLGFKINRKTKTGAGWSHKEAYHLFKNLNFTRLINFDAHHDCYSLPDGTLRSEVDCGNWLLHLLIKKNRAFKAQWVVPKWTEGDESEEVQRYRYDQLANLVGKVVGIYVCQSPAWVPPHHDNIFFDLVAQINQMVGRTGVDFDRGYASRKLASLTREEARDMFNKHKLMMKNLDLGAIPSCG